MDMFIGHINFQQCENRSTMNPTERSQISIPAIPAVFKDIFLNTTRFIGRAMPSIHEFLHNIPACINKIYGGFIDTISSIKNEDQLRRHQNRHFKWKILRQSMSFRMSFTRSCMPVICGDIVDMFTDVPRKSVLGGNTSFIMCSCLLYPPPNDTHHYTHRVIYILARILLKQ